MNEVWCDIIDYPNYVVSNLGKIKNIISNEILKPYKQHSGHTRLTLYNEQGKKRFLVHRLVAFYFIENPNNFKIVNHLNSNPSDNRVQNLEWTTVKGNAIHARDNNRLIAPIGTKNGMSKLVDSEVLKIIDMLNKGLTQQNIADKLNVSRSCIAHIAQGNRWKQYSNLIKGK